MTPAAARPRRAPHEPAVTRCNRCAREAGQRRRLQPAAVRRSLSSLRDLLNPIEGIASTDGFLGVSTASVPAPTASSEDIGRGSIEESLLLDQRQSPVS